MCSSNVPILRQPTSFSKSVFILFICSFLAWFTTSCDPGSSSPGAGISEDSPVAEADSILMTDQFDTALKNPEKADSIIQELQTLWAEKPELEDIYNLGYGRFLILTGKLDEAREHVQSIIDQYGDDSLHYDLAKYHNLMGAVAAYNKEHEESVYHFQQAIRLYERHGDDRQASVIKFNLANIFFGRLDYESAYKYSQEALTPLKDAQDTVNLTLCLSVLSIAEANLGNVEEAKEHARYALRLADDHPGLHGKLFSNYAMGEVELVQEDYADAIARLEQAIALGESQQMLQWLIPVRAALLKAYLAAESYQDAVSVGETLVAQAGAFGNRDVLYSALKNLAFAQENLGQYPQAFGHLKEAEELFREHMSETTERVVQETMAKYETERKNNIILQQENRLSKQRAWGAVLIGGSLVVILGLAWVWENAQQKNKILAKEKENAVYYAITEGEERERKRLSDELHDGIASNLVALKLKLENNHVMSAASEELLSLVSKTHREIRHAAHDLAPLDFEQLTLAEALQTFVSECDHNGCAVTFQANPSGMTRHLPKNIALILYRAVQELMQNALKHADASKISVQLLDGENKLRITVEDNGKGFDLSTIADRQNGGLNNLISRLEKIDAVVDMETRPGIGTTVFIHLQTQKV